MRGSTPHTGRAGGLSTLNCRLSTRWAGGRRLLEILDLLAPRYDVERLGIVKEASPRHADILLCTGPVTRQSRDRLLRIYEQMPAPKWVVAMGSCSCSGGVFYGGHNVIGGIDLVLPVDMYIPGCPCRPEALIDGLARLLATIK